ncbi:MULTISPECIES: histidine kinase [unclassified Rhodococcus (in: high G+C Gram-positive bacteria)]|uniref:sensor histidine kinase n=1 Tax=Rhodococcus sp. SJ-3 TaxID=3454628 RepID=UPI003F7ADDCE
MVSRALVQAAVEAWTPERSYAPLRPRGPSGTIGLVGSVLLLTVLFGTSVGQLTDMVPWVVAAYLLGAVQVLPLVFVFASPLVTWQLMTFGFVAGTVSGLVQDEVVPWPVASCISAGVALIALALGRPLRMVSAATSTSLILVVLPAMWTVGLPLHAVAMIAVAATGIVAAGTVFRRLRAAETHLVVERGLRREQEHREAITRERTRIARELHDVVAHHMSMIAVQTQAATFTHPELPVSVHRTFDDIHTAAATALTEMRSVVDVLREPEAEGGSEAPVLDRLDDLIAGWRGSSGRQVDVCMVGAPETVPPEISSAMYRIVQEALTNAHRHAAGQPVTIEVRIAAGRARLTVRNAIVSGHSVHDGGGHGLIGMRERAAAYGGTAEIGPDDRGRFVVDVGFDYPAGTHDELGEKR